MIIVDAHLDIAYNAHSFQRDYRLPAYAKRRRERPADVDIRRGGPGIATIGLPDALLGRVGVALATVFTVPADKPFLTRFPEPVYHSPREAHDLGMRQLDFYERLTDEDERVQLIRTRTDLEAVLATWDDGTEFTDHRQGLILLMEGADPILEPKAFEAWYERGLRVVGPAWATTRYAHGNGEPGGLTPYGFELLEQMQDFGAVLDLSHLAEQAYFEAIERYEGAIIASHSNPRRFYESDRNLSDEQIRVLAARDGVMGIVLYNVFLHPRLRRGERRSYVPFQTVLDAIDHVCQVTGSARHVGIGSDMDGGFGLESLPEGMDTLTDLWSIPAGLRARGYAEADIEAIAGGNFLRKLREGLPS